MQVKLNPVTKTVSGATTPVARVSYPGFQEILDFTASGSESTVSVAVDGDTDKEYKIVVRNLGAVLIYVQLNSDTGSNYGYQYIFNDAGSISAGRGAQTVLSVLNSLTLNVMSLLTPTGFIKTAFYTKTFFQSGTTINGFMAEGLSYNSTSNITNILFSNDSGNFTAGTRITVYARRSQ